MAVERRDPYYLNRTIPAEGSEVHCIRIWLLNLMIRCRDCPIPSCVLMKEVFLCHYSQHSQKTEAIH